jgi:hypothetical protein
MTTKIRYIISLVAIATISLVLSPHHIDAAIFASETIMYSIDGKRIGFIPKYGSAVPLERLPDGRYKVRYGKLIGYIRSPKLR